MSRFTSSPFHKPAPFHFPPIPLSPPETSTDVGTTVLGRTMINPLDSKLSSGGTMGTTPEPSTSRPRKLSSIHYHSSPLRDTRERTPQRPHKSLVIVIPPDSLIHHHGQLGHTLSTGPQHRLSQGVMMPLFPTMYAQLTAIAREFNFPSIVGLCLYLQLAEGGITTTPRIPDDSWPLLWTHVFDSPTPSPTVGPFIAGRLEFDIDAQHARWYSSWMSSLHREQLDAMPSGFPFTAPGAIHTREESHASLRDDDYVTDNTHHSRYTHTHRHVPRKLSLVERFDARSDSKAPSHLAYSPEDKVPAAAQGLSPIFQEEEPKSARHELDEKILSWRNSAVLKPTPLAKMGQLSLEPANLPNNLPTTGNSTETPVGNDFNLNDFDWSVTSHGPQDYDPTSPISWEHSNSVHLADRLRGSVCLTPSICTSFGPSDRSFSPLAPSSLRLLSPDIAQRILEDCPLSPCTCTSRGPLSPISLSETSSCISSIDLGNRMVFSRPVTPVTATSWGPSDGTWTPSESGSDYEPSVHLADRGFLSPSTSQEFQFTHPFGYASQPLEASDDDRETCISAEYDPYVSQDSVGLEESGGSSQRRSLLLPVVDSSLPSTTMIWKHSWPYSGQQQSRQAIEATVVQSTPTIWKHSWPYSSQPRPSQTSETEDMQSPRIIWKHSWPYSDQQQSRQAIEATVVRFTPTIWKHFWPYRSQPQPSQTSETEDTQSSRIIWKHSWPYKRRSNLNASPSGTFGGSPLRSVVVPSSYPRLNIYPAVYPCFDIYPAVAGYITGHEAKQLPAKHLDMEYSPNSIHSSQPTLEFSVHGVGRPVVNAANGPRAIIADVHQYPFLNIYPSVYPFFDIYPPASCGGVSNNGLQCGISSTGDTGCQTLNISEVQSTIASHSRSPSLVSNESSWRYPFMNIYPPVYPHFDLYPGLVRMELCAPLMHVKCSPTSSYPVVYPYFDIYPSVAVEERSETQNCISNEGYPTFNIYPSVYPYFDLYPPVALAQGSFDSDDLPCIVALKEDKHRPLTTGLAWNYPYFNIYRAVYPHFDLYPKSIIMGERRKSQDHIPVYPSPDILYPHFDLYPPPTVSKDRPNVHSHISVGIYPFFVIYPAIYPYFDLYLTAAAESMHSKPEDLEAPPVSGTTINDTEELVTIITSQTRGTKKSSRLTHSELHAMVMMERLSNEFQTPTPTPPRERPSHHEPHSATFRRNNSLRAMEIQDDNMMPTSQLGVVPRRSQSLKLRVAPLASRNSDDYNEDFFEMITPPIFEGTDSSRPVSTLTPSTSKRMRGVNYNAHLIQESHSDQRYPARSSQPVITPRRSNRDSIVSQRVKALDAAADRALGETLSKFPMPPVSTKPKPVDRTKYPFM